MSQINDPSDMFDSADFKQMIEQIKNDPKALKSYLESKKDDVLQEIEDQKAITFDKAYGDLTNVSKAQDNILSLEDQGKQLNKIQKRIVSNQEKEIHDINDDKQLAQRKYEMNEWSVQNKKETLFIYSMFFILISTIVFLSALLNIGIISSSLFTTLVIPLVVIFILVVIYRVRLTTNYRNRRYWNRRSFDNQSWKIRIPSMSLCPQADNGLNDTNQTPSV